ncbi:hypothetical protein G7085_11675 [Tessaracoccus sp. HDW20]|uniref:hypothetical protein n=1 Tax=Tessaracoccus coleopterorum TaxID=2714950 RepID=UPI0018D2FFB2|nr:hypothetical protein [Tessaracoccus coleopterorum]NHB85047.1 hypothetical protein [Tessaracoccus coleopterorum]
MSEGNAAYFTAFVIFYLINAVPSALFGIALARRAGRPWWHGVLPGFFLPWFGLLFLGNQPAGTPYRTGPARYAMIMAFVAGLMVLISIFLTWVTIDGRTIGQSGELEYAPNQVLPLAIMVWALALGPILASIGLLFGAATASPSSPACSCPCSAACSQPEPGSSARLGCSSPRQAGCTTRRLRRPSGRVAGSRWWPSSPLTGRCSCCRSG